MEDLPDVLWTRGGLGLCISVQQRNGIYSNYIILKDNGEFLKDCNLMTMFVVLNAFSSVIFGVLTSTIRLKYLL